MTLAAALLLALAAPGASLAGEAAADPVAEVRALFGRGDYAAASAAGLPLAGQGNAEVQYMVGFALLHGAGGERDVQQALRWLRASAEGGDPRGQVTLGHCYGRGQGEIGRAHV
jgi:TPR repeat protein